MATSNVSITQTWVKVADASDSSLAIQSHTVPIIEVYTVTASGDAPAASAIGFSGDVDTVFTREMLISGDVYVRIPTNSQIDSGTIILTV